MSPMSIVDDDFSLRSWTNMLSNTGEQAASTDLCAFSTPSVVFMVTSAWMDSVSMRERQPRVLLLATPCTMPSFGQIDDDDSVPLFVAIFRSKNSTSIVKRPWDITSTCHTKSSLLRRSCSKTGETLERRGGPTQETRSTKRASGGCSLASRPGSGKSRTYTDLLFSTDRYQFQMPSLKGSERR